MRLGVFGGTFDPVHRMHLVIAHEVLRAMGLDQVLFVPTGKSSHRDPIVVTEARHRCAMITAAIRGEPRFRLCCVDVERPKRTYTIDTLTDLRAQHDPHTELFVIVGADNLATLPTWHRGRQLMRTAPFVAVSRPGHPMVDPGFAPGRLTMLHVPPLRFSATAIREKVGRGLPVGDLVPEAVVRYIHDHELYRAEPGRALDGTSGARSQASGAPGVRMAPGRQRGPSLNGADQPGDSVTTPGVNWRTGT